MKMPIECCNYVTKGYVCFFYYIAVFDFIFKERIVFLEIEKVSVNKPA